MSATRWTPAAWEAAWAAYDDETYAAALAFLRPGDVVLDIGAGDLRFARQAAKRVRRVIAIEQRPELLPGPRPPNLEVIAGDALGVPFPHGVTVGVLLMRHCRHFAEYSARLRAVGCDRLITNARWGMGVECASLAPPAPFALAQPGWYACACGAVGFKPGPAEVITAALLRVEQSVSRCPDCHAFHAES